MGIGRAGEQALPRNAPAGTPQPRLPALILLQSSLCPASCRSEGRRTVLGQSGLTATRRILFTVGRGLNARHRHGF